MKRVYETPMLYAEEFAPNEYVSACVQGVIQCAIPGRSAYEVGDGTRTRNYNRREVNRNLWQGPTLTYDGLDHGLCGTAAPISFSDSTGSGYEIDNGSIDRNRPIYNIEGYTLAEGSYNVTWNSNSGGPAYNHYGVLTITNIDNSRPNHS